MLFDNINLLEGSDISNLTVAVGADFPEDASIGELFYISSTSQGNQIGLHIYDGADWQLIAEDGTVNGGVSSFNTRSGDVTLTSGDVTGALAYTPLNKAGDTMTGQLTLSADPTNALHAVTKQYADGIAAGLDPKGSVRAATTTNITLSNTQSIDGVSVIAGDRVLVKNQSTGSENGIYVVSAGAWSRAADFDGSPSNEVTGGAYCFVEEGTANADTGWVLTTNNPITIGSTSLVFTQFTGTGGATVAGSNTQIQYNNSGALGADAGLSWITGSTTLSVGTSTTGGTISGTASSAAGRTLTIIGSTGTTGNPGGALNVVAGSAGSGSSGGNLILASGVGSSAGTITLRSGGASGNIAMSVASNSTVNFPGTGSVSTTVTISGNTSSSGALNIQQGSILLAGSAGTNGQVLTSSGGNTPTWSNPTASATLTNTYVGFGAGGVLSGSTDLTWTSGSKALAIGATGGSSAIIMGAQGSSSPVVQGGDSASAGASPITFRGGNASGASSGSGGNVSIAGGTTTNSGGAASGGTISINGGAKIVNSSGTGTAGNVSITGGNASVTGGFATNAGNVTITGGTTNSGTCGSITLTAPAPANAVSAGNISLICTSGSIGSGGTITITAGGSSPNATFTPQGGPITITTGSGTFGGDLTLNVGSGSTTGSGTSGRFIVQTSPVNGSLTSRLQIDGAGAWQVNGGTGSNGQVLTSNGSGVPSWQTPSGLNVRIISTAATTTGSGGNTAGSQTDRFSHTFAANTLSANGQSVEITVYGTQSANTNAGKYINLYINGADVSGDLNFTGNGTAGGWEVRATITRITATSCKVAFTAIVENASVTTRAVYTTPAVDWTTNMTFKMTFNGPSANDVVGQLYKEVVVPITTFS